MTALTERFREICFSGKNPYSLKCERDTSSKQFGEVFLYFSKKKEMNPCAKSNQDIK